MLVVSKYILYFFVYAFLGWCLDVICKLFEKKKFINRGFLVGPICPIYGFGVLFIVILIGENTNDVLSVFLKAILICSVLEYVTSYLMEKLFKARWWDYSKRKFNINGRICLETMVPFGILGCFIVYLLHPLVVKLVDFIHPNVIIILSVIVFIIFVIDSVVSFKVMAKIKTQIKSQKQDNTEVIKKKVEDFLIANSFLYKHIKEAFPKFKINPRERK